MTQKKSFLRNLIGFSIVTWVTFAVGFLTQPIATRLYDPTQLGFIDMFITNANLLMAIALLGLDQACARFYLDRPGGVTKRQLFSFVLITSTVFLFIIGVIILIFFRRVIAIYTVGEDSWIIVILLIVFALSLLWIRYLNLMYRLQENTKFFNLQGLLALISTKVLYLIVAFYNPNHLPAILAMTIANTVIAIFFMIVQRRNYGTPAYENREFVQEVRRFSLPLAPIEIMSWLNASLSMLIITRFLGFHELGIYTRAVTLANLVNIIQAGFNAFWAPYAYANFKDHKDKLWEIHKMMITVVTLLGLGIVLFQDVLFLMLGSEFRSGAVFFPFLLLAPICWTYGEATGLGINISKKTHWSMIILGITVVTNLVLCLLLVPRMGLSGAAIGAAVSGLVSVVMRTIIGERHYRLLKNMRYIGYSLLILSLLAVGNYLAVGHVMLRYVVTTGLLVLSCFVFHEELKVLVSKGFSYVIQRK